MNNKIIAKLSKQKALMDLIDKRDYNDLCERIMAKLDLVKSHLDHHEDDWKREEKVGLDYLCEEIGTGIIILSQFVKDTHRNLESSDS